ncbi:MAG: hypothetical protein KDA57_23035 [Planctomycetales bacterium]|nr:hypothetical protein [Planctomycetales bacterium]
MQGTVGLLQLLIDLIDYVIESDAYLYGFRFPLVEALYRHDDIECRSDNEALNAGQDIFNL